MIATTKNFLTHYLNLASLAAMPFALLLVGGAICPVALSTGVACPGCGGCRSVGAALTGDFSESIKLHPLALPSLVGFGTIAFALTRKNSTSQKMALWLSIALAITLISLWAYRALTGTLPPI